MLGQFGNQWSFLVTKQLYAFLYIQHMLYSDCEYEG